MDKKKSQGIILIVAGIALLALIFILRGAMSDNDLSPATTPPPAPATAPGTLTSGDTDAEISQDIESLELNDIENEFKSLDADVNSL